MIVYVVVAAREHAGGFPEAVVLRTYTSEDAAWQFVRDFNVMDWREHRDLGLPVVDYDTIEVVEQETM